MNRAARGRLWRAGALCGGLLVVATPAHAQLRVVDYNVGASSSSSSGPRPGMDSILQAINAQARPGFARQIDILLLQEGEGTDTTGLAFANLLNTVAGGTGYRASSLEGDSSGAGRPMAVYNSATVSLVGERAVGTVGSSGPARQTIRFQFRPVGYDAGADFYVYNSHFKSSDDATSRNRRQAEAQGIRSDADALGAGSNVIYAGDFNLYKAVESAFQTLVGPGNGQAFDPIDQIGDWSDTAAFKAYHTQSPAATTAAYPGQVLGGMDDRFDFQLVTGAWLDGRGLDYLGDSYWAFGNTGTHTMNQAITSGSPAALQAFLPGYTLAQSETILSRLSQVADHLPVVADYQIPAKLSAGLAGLPSRVVTGAVVTGTLSVSNSAPVSVARGADRLDYTFGSSGILAGTGTGSGVSPGTVSTHPLAVTTADVGLVSGTVSVHATSPQAGSPSFAEPVTMSVLDHARGSFASAVAITTLDVDFGTLTQGTGTVSREFSIFNRPGTLGALWTASLDLDDVAAGVPPGGIFSTTLSPFVNLAAGSSRTYGLSMATATTGSFTGTYTLSLSDEDLPGAAGQSLSLTVRGVVNSPANAILDVASGTHTQASLGYGAITGPSSITKIGGGTVVLDGLNTFTGSTFVNQGVTAVSGAGAIASSGMLDVAPGAVLDVRALAAGYHVTTGQTLGGSGTVVGSVSFGAGSTLSPGLFAAAAGSGGMVAGEGAFVHAAVSVPEPGTVSLVCIGACVVGVAARAGRRRQD